MPGGDKSGPLGGGPMTGRGAGLCSGNDVPGYANSAPGWGFGRGRGFRRGFGRGYGRGFMNRGVAYLYRGVSDDLVAERLDASEVLTELKSQARHYGRVLDEINKRLRELQNAPKKE